ncbi:phosphomannomutase [Candidatus Aerophobetes bacterium]|uniref:Phosphomannomutase n=1 Tax=Aerophobetes bacterium TaxID=2030807 RepID=A0A2A4X5X6_UNCAE|nr:MAG: phosphomannomutase [Candidatus Aerophobetes bacterium]
MCDELSSSAKHQIELWQKPPFDSETIKAVTQMQNSDPDLLHACFYTRLSFGTGGLRGLMGPGTNRMNSYTVAAATSGLGAYLKQRYKGEKGVFISYDGRHHSEEFAWDSARILAALGIHVFITPGPRPTPFVSFGLRHHGCKAGIMITASHNGPAYNGFKVYGVDGAQCTSPEDLKIIEAVNAINDLSLPEMSDKKNPLIHITGKSEEKAYFDQLQPLALFPKQNQNQGATLGIVYSSLHGVGYTLMEQGMKNWGFSNFHLVAKQCVLDGDFTYALNPNPETPETLAMGSKQMLDTGKDLFIANDPDADRMAAVASHGGKAVTLTGNQIASLLAYSLLNTYQKRGQLDSKSAIVTTIVSTPLLSVIAKAFNTQCYRTLTGFKYIGEKIKQWEQSPNGNHFLFGAEESLGYLVGTHSRDKDGIIAALILSEIALDLKLKNKTLIDLLFEIYAKYGLFVESQISLNFPATNQGFDQMKNVMDKLKQTPLKEINQSETITFLDYLEGTSTSAINGTKTALDLPSSNVLGFITADKSRYFIRPSGTEPKVKIYAMLQKEDSNPSFKTLHALELETKKRLQALKAHLESLV